MQDDELTHKTCFTENGIWVRRAQDSDIRSIHQAAEIMLTRASQE